MARTMPEDLAQPDIFELYDIPNRNNDSVPDITDLYCTEDFLNEDFDDGRTSYNNGNAEHAKSTTRNTTSVANQYKTSQTFESRPDTRNFEMNHQFEYSKDINPFALCYSDLIARNEQNAPSSKCDPACLDYISVPLSCLYSDEDDYPPPESGTAADTVPNIVFVLSPQLHSDSAEITSGTSDFSADEHTAGSQQVPNFGDEFYDSPDDQWGHEDEEEESPTRFLLSCRSGDQVVPNFFMEE